MSTYIATNQSGERCIPAKYTDGYYRFALYVRGDKNWKAKEKNMLVPEHMLDWAMSQKGLSVRMKIEEPAAGAAKTYELFKVENCSPTS